MKTKPLYTLKLYVRAADSGLACNVLDQAAAICEQHDVLVEAKEVTIPSERTIGYFDARASSARTSFVAALIGFILLFAMGFWFGTEAQAADEYTIGTILKSDHYLGEDDYHEDHWPSAYFGWRHGMHQYVAGFFENSEESEAHFFMYGQRTNEYISVFIGGATGYENTPIMPMVGVKINLGPVTIMPALGVVAYGLEYRHTPTRTHP